MKTSERFALDAWLSYYPSQASYDKIIDAMTDREQAHKAEHIDAWEIVEDLDYEHLAQIIDDTKAHFENTVRDVIAETGYKQALQELLNYTGGWDITDENHPIYKARKVLEKELDI